MKLVVVFAESAIAQKAGQRPLPTLGEIVDKLAEEKPDITLKVAPAWRDRHVAKVRIMAN